MVSQYTYPTDLDGLLEIVPSKNHADRALIKHAYEYAEKAHENQFRKSGEPYFTHCVAVASILAGVLQLDTETIAAGLLHDVIEDNDDIEYENVMSDFGETIVRLVDGVTKITNLPMEDYGLDSDMNRTDKKTLQKMEAFRKLLLFMNKDERVVLVKLADRLHNMRTLDSTSPEHQRRTAQETMDFFAPLANRLGIWKLKWELEDLSFKYLSPVEYHDIAHKLDEKRKDRDDYIARMTEKIKKALTESGIDNAIITGRQKHIYSIYRKMKRKGLPLEEIYDVRAIRIIVENKKQCYLALMEIHDMFQPIPGEFDDYIAAPKESQYRSLHTAVMDEKGKILEVQIRSHDMHEEAEYGIAAHWIYKEGQGGKKDRASEHKIAYLRRLLSNDDDELDEINEDMYSESDELALETGDTQTDDESQGITGAERVEMRREKTRDFMNRLRDEVFEERVYIFTPKGDITDLPQGSTPIDFAYSIHTEIGHRCRGAKVSGQLKPLHYKLKNGDQVEIMTAKRGGPSLDWLNDDLGYIKTTRARNKIMHWFRRQHRNQNIANGREVLESSMKQLGVLDKLSFESVSKLFNYSKVDDFLISIGTGHINASKIARVIEEDNRKRQEESSKTELELIKSRLKNGRHATNGGSVRVMGVDGVTHTLARCCNPVVGDGIIGFVTRGYGVTVHRVDCSNITNLQERDRLIEVSWGSVDEGDSYLVPIHVQAQDRPGLLNDITTLIAAEHINIADLDVTTKQQTASLYFDLRITDTSQLARILSKINKVDSVYEAHRVNQSL